MSDTGTAVTPIKDRGGCQCGGVLCLDGYVEYSLPSEIASLATALWKRSIDDIEGVKSSLPPSQTALLQSEQSSDMEINTAVEAGRRGGSADNLSEDSGSGENIQLATPFPGSLGIDELDLSMLVRALPCEDNFELDKEYPFLTEIVNNLPAGIRFKIDGAISVHSVELLTRNLTPVMEGEICSTNLSQYYSNNTSGEIDIRDQQWKELRMEVRWRAKCSLVIGCSESTSICDEICLLTTQGTTDVLITPKTNLTNLKALLENQAAAEALECYRREFRLNFERVRGSFGFPFLSPSGCTFWPVWGKMPLSKKVKILCQFGKITITAIVKGICGCVARKLNAKYAKASKYKRRLIVAGGVTAAFFISSVLAGFGVGIGVPMLLAYFYGFFPIRFRRGGGVTTSASGVRIESNEESNNHYQGDRDSTSNRSIAGASLIDSVASLIEKHWPSGWTVWSKKSLSPKRNILWQLGTLVGAPVGITFIAGIAVPAMIIGIRGWVGRTYSDTI